MDENKVKSSNSPSDRNKFVSPSGTCALRSVVWASFYGLGLGVGIISYLSRSGWLKFYRRNVYGMAPTAIDVLAYPKQMDVCWYLMGIFVPLTLCFLFGRLQRDRGLFSERGLLLSLLLFIAQSPFLAIEAWPGAIVAGLHLAALTLLPFAAGRYLQDPDGLSPFPSVPPPYRPMRLLPPILLLLFAGLNMHAFITLHGMKLAGMALGTLAWAVILAAGYGALFYSVRRLMRLPKDISWNRATWGLLPVMILPLYNLAWGQRRVLTLMLIGVALMGLFLFIRAPKRSGAIAAMIMLPLGVGMTMHLSPYYRFTILDMVHEGQQLAFAQCVYRGWLPGVEKAPKYGPLWEFSLGWLLMLFGPKLTVLRIYSLWEQALGYWAGVLVMTVFIRRRWVLVYGWIGYLIFSIAVYFQPGHWNGLRVGLPMFALVMWAMRCRGGGIGWIIGAGAAGAMGAVYSVEFGLAGVFAMMGGLLARGLGEGFSKGWRVVLKEAAGMAAGVALIAAPFTAMYAMRGGVISLITGIFEYARGFSMGYASFPFPRFPWLDSEAMGIIGVSYFVERLRFCLGPLVAISCGGWLASRYVSGRWRPELAAVAALWVYAAMAFRSAMGRSDIFHLVQAVAPSVVLMFIMADRLAAAFYSELMRKIKPGWGPAILAAMAAAIFLLAPMTQKSSLRGAFRRLASHHLRKDYAQIEKYFRRRGYRPINVERLSGIWEKTAKAARIEAGTKFILENTAPDERLHIFPLYGAYFFFADRLPFSRYVQPTDAILPKAKKEILDQLKKEKPRMVLGNLSFGTNFPYSQEHPEEARYIVKHYKKVRRVGHFDVYMRKEGGGDDE